MGDLAHSVTLAAAIVGFGLLLSIAAGVALAKRRAHRHRRIARSQRRSDTRIDVAAAARVRPGRRRRSKRPSLKIDLFGSTDRDA